MEERWKKVIAERVGDVLGDAGLEPESIELLEPEMRPEAFVQALSEAELWVDAIKVLAHSLPPRELVWWACVCARHSGAVADDREEMAALVAAERWVYKPSKENRHEAFRLVQESTSGSAGSVTAMAAAFSEGTTPLADGKEVENEDNSLPGLVLAAVMISANASANASANIEANKDFDEQSRIYVESARDIACGGDGRIDSLKDA